MGEANWGCATVRDVLVGKIVDMSSSGDVVLGEFC